MELNNKVQELEDELKVLKAEIRNVLLDIREVILDKTNPLAEEHESAFIRMDLNTTARAVAAEAAAREANNAAEQAEQGADPTADDKADASKPEDGKPSDTADEPPKGKASRKGKGASKSATKEDAPPAPAEIPAMYRASAPSAASALGLAAWVANAMTTVGPQQVDRVITIHRLCGTLPPNVSEALAHLQELIRSSDGEEPHWLKVLEDLDNLASS